MMATIYSGDVELQAGDPVRVLNSVPLPDRPITLVIGGLVETLPGDTEHSAFSVRLTGHNHVERMNPWRQARVALIGGGG